MGGGRAVKRLLLVGGGHAHVEVLRSIQKNPIPRIEVLLVSTGRFAAYTGMVPGYLAGRYTSSMVCFDLDALARAVGGSFVDDAVEQVDGAARTVRVNGRQMSFDACSIDIGSAPAGSDVPGVRENAVPLRPLANVLTLRQRFDALAVAGRNGAQCVVVGGGAGGVEVALALATRSEGRVGVSLVHDGEELLPGYPSRARRIAAAACRRAGVTVETGTRVESVAPDHVRLARGIEWPSNLTVWLTGAAPPAMLASSNLPRSQEGYLSVDNALRAIDGSPVWGAGDCITQRGHEWVPKAGVYAVRQGPVLAHNLRVFLQAHGPTKTYRPQSGFLSLLSTSDDRALLVYRGIALESRWAQALKRFIDQRFMNRYRFAPADEAMPLPESREGGWR
ncbi:FAD-dependent oxidoreductase [soil metagenome]